MDPRLRELNFTTRGSQGVVRSCNLAPIWPIFQTTYLNVSHFSSGLRAEPPAGADGDLLQRGLQRQDPLHRLSAPDAKHLCSNGQQCDVSVVIHSRQA